MRIFTPEPQFAAVQALAEASYRSAGWRHVPHPSSSLHPQAEWREEVKLHFEKIKSEGTCLHRLEEELVMRRREELRCVPVFGEVISPTAGPVDQFSETRIITAAGKANSPWGPFCPFQTRFGHQGTL